MPSSKLKSILSFKVNVFIFQAKMAVVSLTYIITEIKIYFFTKDVTVHYQINMHDQYKNKLKTKFQTGNDNGKKLPHLERPTNFGLG